MNIPLEFSPILSRTMKTLFLSTLALSAVVLSPLRGEVPTATSFLKSPNVGDPGLKSVGPLAFGPDGLLLIAEPGIPAVVAVATGDRGPLSPLVQPLGDTLASVAKALSADPKSVQIIDLAANPASGTAYLAVRDESAKRVVIVSVRADGTVTKLDWSTLPHVRVPLPKSETAAVRTISDLAFAGDRVLVTAQSSEEFSSKILSLPLPLDATGTGRIFSAETYHVSHRKWETKAPIQSFVPYLDNGVPCVLGAFACTPLAKFPLADLESGANIRGTSVVELGSGNRPLDVFTYRNKAGAWIVTNTLRFHQPLFGPSKYWGVRVNLDLAARQSETEINENALRRNVKEPTRTPEIEIVEALHGAVQVDKIDDTRMIVLREDEDRLKLEVCALP